MKSFSILVLFIGISIQLYFGHIFYPTYNAENTNTTIGWDVSGYYFYLPAFIIYKDAKELKWKDKILEKNRPTPDLQQAYLHSSGNYVMKYSIGQSLVYAPFFAIAHCWASRSSKYEADGFSYPYQFMISISSVLISFLGLFYLRKILLYFFRIKIQH